MRNRSKAFGNKNGQRVGYDPDLKLYYIRNRFGAEIDVPMDQMDAFIETAMIVRNQTRRLRRTS